MKSLEFDSAAFEDLAWWVEHDRKQALKIIKLIQEVQRTPCAKLFIFYLNASPLLYFSIFNQLKTCLTVRVSSSSGNTGKESSP